MANELFCPICDQEMQTLVSAYHKSPFIDGRRYEFICHCCSEVPRMYEANEDGYHNVFKEFDKKRLHSVDDLMEFGWDKQYAKTSLKAVQAKIKKSK
jgi:hypothetical protein